MAKDSGASACDQVRSVNQIAEGAILRDRIAGISPEVTETTLNLINVSSSMDCG